MPTARSRRTIRSPKRRRANTARSGAWPAQSVHVRGPAPQRPPADQRRRRQLRRDQRRPVRGELCLGRAGTRPASRPALSRSDLCVSPSVDRRRRLRAGRVELAASLARQVSIRRLRPRLDPGDRPRTSQRSRRIRRGHPAASRPALRRRRTAVRTIPQRLGHRRQIRTGYWKPAGDSPVSQTCGADKGTIGSLAGLSLL